MKIESLEIKDNSIFGDIFIDFADWNGKIEDTIILAGVNGSGKTVILKTILYYFSKLFPYSFKNVDFKSLETLGINAKLNIEIKNNKCSLNLNKYGRFSNIVGVSQLIRPLNNIPIVFIDYNFINNYKNYNNLSFGEKKLEVIKNTIKKNYTTIVLIDGFEDGLHPSFQKKLCITLEEMKKEIPFQLIVTTHSKDVAKFFGKEKTRFLLR